ncbi:hypothetical protein HYX15_02205 [Candidatus Woesearchaeota archaeon]|nr:hypothetical protein [Candidatus Woesearchaeota archaeon]
MEKKGVIFLLIIILIIGSFILMLQSQKSNPEELTLSKEDKEYLLDLAYKSIKLNVEESKRFIELNPPADLSNYNNEVFVSVWSDGVLKGSYLGNRRDIMGNVITASIGTTKHYLGGIKKEDLDNLHIYIYIVKNKKLIEDKSLENIEKEINLEKDYTRIQTLDGKHASYSNYIPSLYNLDHEETLRNLCLKLERNYPILERFDENCWKDEAFNIYKLEMIEFEKEFITN